jgi:UDP-N-acetylglucosamine 3-dehydrogenase
MTLRAGLIGLGAMGRHHARVLRQLDGVELVAVADPGGDAYGVSGTLSVLASAAELAAAGIDMAVVAVPTVLHEDVALTLAEAGVHTMVEKPLAPTAAAARRISEAFESRGLVGCVGHIERFNPALQQARKRLENGDLGEVYQIATRRQGPFPARIADVGVIKDLATHDIDLTAWVAQRDYITVKAQVAHRSGREHEDLVAAVGLLEGGIVTNHLVNWLTPFKERLTGSRANAARSSRTRSLPTSRSTPTAASPTSGTRW